MVNLEQVPLGHLRYEMRVDEYDLITASTLYSQWSTASAQGCAARIIRQSP